LIALDDTRFYIFATPAEGVELKDLDTALDRVLAKFIETKISEEDLRRAKTRMIPTRSMRATAGLAGPLVWRGLGHRPCRQERRGLARPN